LLVVVSFFAHHSSSQALTLSLHDALPIWSTSSRDTVGLECHSHTGFGSRSPGRRSTSRRMMLPEMIGSGPWCSAQAARLVSRGRSEEHTSELQSRFELVCRLLLEKKKNE